MQWVNYKFLSLSPFVSPCHASGQIMQNSSPPSSVRFPLSHQISCLHSAIIIMSFMASYKHTVPKASLMTWQLGPSVPVKMARLLTYAKYVSEFGQVIRVQILITHLNLTFTTPSQNLPIFLGMLSSQGKDPETTHPCLYFKTNLLLLDILSFSCSVILINSIATRVYLEPTIGFK